MQQNSKFEGKERRRHKRYAFEYLVDFSISFRRMEEKDFQVSTSGNISYGGALILSPYRHEIGEPIEVKIAYLGEDERQVEMLYQTEVRWIDERSDAATSERPYSIGVEFLDMTEAQEGCLEYFIETFIRRPEDEILTD